MFLENSQWQRNLHVNDFVPNCDLSKYIEEMKQSGTFGDHVTLQAAAQTFNIHIFVVSSRGDSYAQYIKATSAHAVPTIVLGHYSNEDVVGGHYVVLKPVRDRNVSDIISSWPSRANLLHTVRSSEPPTTTVTEPASPQVPASPSVASEPTVAVKQCPSSETAQQSTIFQLSGEICISTKRRLISSRKPESSYKLPSKAFVDSKKKDGITMRNFNVSRLDKYPWMYYCKTSNGVGCLACILFSRPTDGKYNAVPTEVMVSRPHTNFRKTNVDADKHAGIQYHKDAEARLVAFMETEANPDKRIDFRLHQQNTATVHENRRKIKALLQPLVFCGSYGLAIRGKVDHGDVISGENALSGVFRGLLHLLVQTGNKQLETQLKTAKKNATYLSPQIQNELLDAVRLEIEDNIVSEIRQQDIGPKFCIMADEVTDVTNWEQLGIAVRYLKDDRAVERLLGFEKCESITGEATSHTIISFLESKGLDIMDARGQNYDGAGNMSGANKGCAARISAINPRAPYVHCASHDLNLALNHAAKVPTIFIMMENLASMGRFFAYSPKRQRAFEVEVERHNHEGLPKDEQIKKTKIKALCKTRWFEKHQIFKDVHEMFVPLVACLKKMCDNDATKSWDRETITKARGHLNTLSSSDFIAAFETVRFCFLYTHDMSKLLQGTAMDVVWAYEEGEGIHRHGCQGCCR